MVRKTSRWMAAASVSIVALLPSAAEAQLAGPSVPDVDVRLEPDVHGATVLTQVAPAKPGAKPRWILNAMWSITNNSGVDLTLETTSLTVGGDPYECHSQWVCGQDAEGPERGAPVDIPAVDIPAGAQGVLVPATRARLQGGEPDPLVTAHGFQGDMPHPTTASWTLTFEGYEPVVGTSTLRVHRHETPSGAYRFPLKATDLAPDLYWANGDEDQDNMAHHYSTSQAYAYDIVAQRWTGSTWTTITKVWAKLHTGDPGAHGTNDAAAETRMKEATLAPLRRAGMDPTKPPPVTTTAPLTWLGVASAEEYSYVSFWSAPTGGTFWGSVALKSPPPVVVDGDFTIAPFDFVNPSLKNEAYLAFGKPVYAMAAGTAVYCRRVEDDYSATPNRVWIKHGEDEYAVYTHLKKDSIPEELCNTGATVEAGQPIGRVGNTGNSAQPHLHVHLSAAPPPSVDDQGGPGLPLMFERFETAQYVVDGTEQRPPLAFSVVPAETPRAIPRAGIVVPSAFVFAGFAAPVNNNLVNAARAGQTIPVKYRLTSHDGTPISDPASFTSVKSQIGGSLCMGVGLDVLEAYAAGGSGLQYLGDGNWQFNWKTPKDFAGQCRTMTLTLADRTTHIVTFRFT